MVEKQADFAKKFSVLEAMIKGARSAVVLTGAGISTLSGIPDFRSSKGLYSEKWGNLAVEEILSLSFFSKHPEVFYAWARDVWYGLEHYQPNVVHQALSSMEEKGYLEGLFTQNIDMLHSKAGSKRCYEVHGSAKHHHCTHCNAYYSYEQIAPIVRSGEVPLCTQCNSVIKPDIVFYGENLDSMILFRAYEMFSHTDLCLVLGSSLVVQPAASFPSHAFQHGAPLVMVHAQKTGYDNAATLHFSDLNQFGEALASYLSTLEVRKRLV